MVLPIANTARRYDLAQILRQAMKKSQMKNYYAFTFTVGVSKIDIKRVKYMILRLAL